MHATAEHLVTKCFFVLQCIASVTKTHHASFVDVAGPSTECNSAVASTTVEPSTSSEHALGVAA